MEIPKISLEEAEWNAMCFGCGKENKHGLHMKFHQEDSGTVKSEFTPGENHQGWPGYIHGGILMTVMDEAIGWTGHLNNIYSVTAKIDVRLRSMVRVGEPLTVSARITKQTSRTLEVQAKITRPDSSLVAEASSLQFIIQPPKNDRF